jgi:uncharacterized repeat protein (TIGR03803 family)
MFKRHLPSFRIVGFIVLAIVAMLVNSASATTSERSIYSFTGGFDGADPASQLVFDSAGNAYGTTVTGGASDCGTVFKLTPTGGGQWHQSVLHSFNCFDEGKNPYGGVTLDASGNLYGTTVAGGSGGFCSGDGCGVVFELAFSGGVWSETVLYNFGDLPDAAGPGSAVVFDRAGNLYGTSPDGGQFAAGTVYRLSFANGHWSETILHDFTGGDDGALGSLGALFLDRSGNFYGVTELGGAYSAGTVFKLSPGAGGSWTFTTQYAFKGQPDAAFPYGGLIADQNGMLYGTTYYGGVNGVGAVFKVGPPPNIVGPASAVAGWRDTVLYSFQGGPDGGSPTSTLVFDADRNLYGTASAGGDPGCDCGVAFKLSPNQSGGWNQSVLHTFGTHPDGSYPYYGLTPDGAGNYYGTTAAGGNQNQGMIFELTP